MSATNATRSGASSPGTSMDAVRVCKRKGSTNTASTPMPANTTARGRPSQRAGPEVRTAPNTRSIGAYKNSTHASICNKAKNTGPTSRVSAAKATTPIPKKVTAVASSRSRSSPPPCQMRTACQSTSGARKRWIRRMSNTAPESGGVVSFHPPQAHPGGSPWGSYHLDGPLRPRLPARRPPCRPPRPLPPM